MLLFIIQIIRIAGSVFSWLVIIGVLLSYFMSPFHPVRRTIDSILNPMLAPIRKVVPSFGGFDFSPIVLILAIRVAEIFLISVLSSMV